MICPKDNLSAALEHAAHAWYALQQAGLAPETIAWPPEASQGGVGSPSYHLAAMIRYVKSAYDDLPKEPTQ